MSVFSKAINFTQIWTGLKLYYKTTPSQVFSWEFYKISQNINTLENL